jgi:hypothetical protein
MLGQIDRGGQSACQQLNAPCSGSVSTGGDKGQEIRLADVIPPWDIFPLDIFPLDISPARFGRRHVGER